MTPTQFHTIRKRLKLTQAGLAKAIGMTIGMIGNYERGVNRGTGRPIVIPLYVELAVNHLLCLSPKPPG